MPGLPYWVKRLQNMRLYCAVESNVVFVMHMPYTRQDISKTRSQYTVLENDVRDCGTYNKSLI